MDMNILQCSKALILLINLHNTLQDRLTFLLLSNPLSLTTITSSWSL